MKSSVNIGYVVFLSVVAALGGFLFGYDTVWGIERSGFFNGREKWAKGFENQRV